MAERLAGFPFWIVEFDARGQLIAPAEHSLADEIIAAAVTDLFVFTHGWNNSRRAALDRYRAFFAQVQDLLASPALGRRRTATVGVMGVIWPSLRWADEDEPPPAPVAGGAAAFAPASLPNDAALVESLQPLFPHPAQQTALAELASLLATRPHETAQLRRFQTLMATLVTDRDAAQAPEDSGEATLVRDDPIAVYERLATVAMRPTIAEGTGGAAGLLDVELDRLWDGAKEALRAVTYWEMKQRAGIVGRAGVGGLLGRLHAATPTLRVHLIGHSFGARAVSFALQGLSARAADDSPVKSVVLLQGAFSHFAFARALPHDPGRGGALAGMTRRIDGPLVVTHSPHDRALGLPYALASMTSGEDAAALADVLFRWGAMGHDGAQAATATATRLGPVGSAYRFGRGKICNLDGDAVIKTNLSWINGAHSDIVHPEIAWAVLCAAGILEPAN